jgi:alpha-tubulin suppressor-like RCC1 family protein
MGWRAVLGGLLLLACGGRAATDPAWDGSLAGTSAGGAGVAVGGSTTSAGGSTTKPVTGCVAEVSANSTAACALRTDGAVFCWGNNARGQVGSLTESPAHVTRIEALGDGVLAVSRGGEFTCALDRNRDLWCWGGNNFGQRGDGIVGFDSPVPQRVLPIQGQVVALSGGGTHMCARTAERDAWCWGNNGWGELGLGFTSRTASGAPGAQGEPTPKPVPALLGQVELLAGAEVQTCASNGTTTWCWGGRDDNAGAGPPDPQVVAWGGVPTELSMGPAKTCAVDHGQVTCWHSDYHVRPELFELEQPTFAEPVHGVALGPWHGCAIGESGRLYCWGNNDKAQLGRATEDALMNPPGEVTRHAPGYLRVAAGDGFTCAIDSQSELWCWGDNTFGPIAYVEQSHDNTVTEPVRIDIPCD